MPPIESGQLPLPFEKRPLKAGPQPEQIALPFEENAPTGSKETTSARQAILNHIETNGGATKKEVQDALKLSPMEAVGHLNTLKKYGLIEYDSASKKWIPAKETANATEQRQPVGGVSPENGAGGPRAGVEMPVPQRIPDVALPFEADVRGVGHPAESVEQHLNRETAGPPPLTTAGVEPHPQLETINFLKAKAADAFKKGKIDGEQLKDIKGELSSPDPDFQYLTRLLTIANSNARRAGIKIAAMRAKQAPTEQPAQIKKPGEDAEQADQ
jgi:hypothetical protein